MKSHRHNLLALAACGLVGGLASVSAAQPYVINISGATLLENYVKAPASTHDAIDIDGDGVITASGVIDQLAPANPPSGSNWWVVQYRVVGSVNGFQELIDFGRTFETNPEATSPITALEATIAYCNRSRYINAGVAEGIKNLGNPGAAPVRSSTDGAYVMQYTTPDLPAPGGIQIDIAPLDVPARWAVCYDGSFNPSEFDLIPGNPGYGCNPTVSLTKSGTPTTFGHTLADPGDLVFFDPSSPPPSTATNVIFDTSIFFAPIATVVNYGVGLEQATITELRHLFTTGRAASGENLMAVTRDSGSGTRNAYMNCLGVDPSHGIGDNIGTLSTLSDWNRIGPSFQPTNKGGNSGVEATVINCRLGVGYAGAERGVAGSWLTGGRMDILAVRNDILGGVEYSRPTIGEVLDNNANGYVIGGPATLATIGDPRSAPAAKGGDAGNTNPDMRNVEAAAYVNNITRSIAAVTAAPGSDPTIFTPGEFAATQFILTAAQDFIHNPLIPSALLPNPDVNQVVQDFTRLNNVLANPVYATFGAVSRDGRVPSRQTSGVTAYTDGLVNNYRTQGGALLTYGDPLPSRNRIAGDFSGDARRDWSDAAEMLKALRQREGGPAWTAPAGTGPIAGAPGNDASIEVLGDFNGDGNFDRADIRYWADGLALSPATGKLSRAEGFIRADNAAAAAGVGLPLFPTVLATGASYQAGDARADIAGATGTTPGFAPVGHDGRIDAKDIDYVFAQLRTGGDVDIDWSVLTDAYGRDLSADVNGDLRINAQDVQAILDILGTTQCDVNLDGAGDQADVDIVSAHLGQPGGWAQGDVDGSGTVDAADLSIVSGCASSCPADLNGDGIVDFADYLDFLNYYDAQDLTVDFNQDGIVDFSDYLEFLNFYDAGC